MKIKFEIDYLAWASFVENHKNGNVFQTPDMFKVYEKTKNYEPILIAVENDTGELEGILLAVIQKEHSGILGNFSARSIIMGGPLIKNDDPQILDFILKEYDNKIKSEAIYSQFRNFWDWKELTAMDHVRKLKLQVVSNKDGKLIFNAIRTCDKDGGFGSLKLEAIPVQ